MSFLSFFFSLQAINSKLIILLTPFVAYLQTVSGIGFWEKILNLSVALFVLIVGIYILWKEYQEQKRYSQDRNDKIIELVERTTEIAQTAINTAQNSTKVMKDTSKSLDRILTKLEHLED